MNSKPRRRNLKGKEADDDPNFRPKERGDADLYRLIGEKPKVLVGKRDEKVAVFMPANMVSGGRVDKADRPHFLSRALLPPS